MIKYYLCTNYNDNMEKKNEEKVFEKPIFEDATVRKISAAGDCSCASNQCP